MTSQNVTSKPVIFKSFIPYLSEKDSINFRTIVLVLVNKELLNQKIKISGSWVDARTPILCTYEFEVLLGWFFFSLKHFSHFLLRHFGH